jgi:hypothetical protein
MGEISTTSATLDQTDEDVLSYTVSDEALEAAAGIEKQSGLNTYTAIPGCPYCQRCSRGRGRALGAQGQGR